MEEFEGGGGRRGGGGGGGGKAFIFRNIAKRTTDVTRE